MDSSLRKCMHIATEKEGNLRADEYFTIIPLTPINKLHFASKLGNISFSLYSKI